VPEPPPPGRKGVRVGPLEIILDLGPFIRGVEFLMKAYQGLVDTLSGPELMRIIEDLYEGKREPKDEFERALLRAIKGATRFERINEEE